MQAPNRSVPPAGARRTVQPPAQPAAPEPKGVEPLELLGFALRAARRHLQLCLLAGLATSAVAMVIVSALPSVYQSTAKYYITQSNAVTVALAQGRRLDDGSSAMRGVQESVMGEENLRAIIAEAHLIEHWPRTRTWALAAKDSVQAAVLGPPSREDLERAVLEMLKTAMSVSTMDNTSIRITVQWRDPADAHRIIELARRNFFSERSSDQAAAIKRAISLLEQQLKQADAAIDPAVKELQAEMDRSRAESAKERTAQNVPAAPRPVPSAPAPVSASDVLTSERLQEIRRNQRELSEPWQRRQAELRMQMAELRTIFGPEHPLVAQQEAKLAAASEPPPELAKLRTEEAQLEERVRLLGTVTETTAAAPRRTPSAGSAPSLSVTLDRPEDPQVATARARVETALSKSRELSSRLDAARLELATAEAGDKYRYSVVEAPEVARKPIKPKRPALMAAALVLGLLVGLLAGAVRDLLSGRLLEPWQVRTLGLELLGDVALPAESATRSVRDRA